MACIKRISPINNIIEGGTIFTFAFTRPKSASHPQLLITRYIAPANYTIKSVKIVESLTNKEVVLDKESIVINHAQKQFQLFFSPMEHGFTGNFKIIITANFHGRAHDETFLQHFKYSAPIKKRTRKSNKKADDMQ